MHVLRRITLRLRKMGGWGRNKELYEWNPGNGIWYPIHRRNILFDNKELRGSERRILNNKVRKFFNRLLRGETVEASGFYSKGKLTILSLSPISVPVDSRVPKRKNTVETASFQGRP